MAFIQLSNLAIASDICFKNNSAAKNAAAQVDYLIKTNKNNTDIINGLSSVNTQLNAESAQKDQKINLLLTDKTELQQRGDAFEKDYKDTSDKLVKCTENTPSRLNWFGYGFMAAIILGVLGAFAIK